MKVTVDIYGDTTLKELRDVVEHELLLAIDGGVTEHNSIAIDQIARALGRLIDTLVERGTITLDEVPAIIGHVGQFSKP